jgi:hypothetical protein
LIAVPHPQQRPLFPPPAPPAGGCRGAVYVLWQVSIEGGSGWCRWEGYAHTSQQATARALEWARAEGFSLKARVREVLQVAV